MARKKNVLPSYLLHKTSGQARVRIDGRDYLLGPYGSDESRIRYAELVSKAAGGLQIDPLAESNRGKVPRNESPGDSGLSVAELLLAFARHAESYYVSRDWNPSTSGSLPAFDRSESSSRSESTSAGVCSPSLAIIHRRRCSESIIFKRLSE